MAIARPFEEYIDKTESCHLWLGGKDTAGYGLYHIIFPTWHKLVRAHRYAYELAKGSIPEGMDLLHRCDNHGCVNPDHLYVGTDDENVQDRYDRFDASRFVQAKLDPDKVREIRRMVKEGKTQTDLAKEFGVSAGTISMVVNNKRWSRVGE